MENLVPLLELLMKAQAVHDFLSVHTTMITSHNVYIFFLLT